MKVKVQLLAAICLMSIVSSNLFANSLLQSKHNPQKKKDNDEKEKVMKVIPLPPSLLPFEQNIGFQFSLAYEYDRSIFTTKKISPPIYFLPLKVTVKGFKAVFGGPAYKPTGNPYIDYFMFPVYSQNRDPFTKEFWWD